MVFLRRDVDVERILQHGDVRLVRVHSNALPAFLSNALSKLHAF